jgi:hypothetical protein
MGKSIDCFPQPYADCAVIVCKRKTIRKKTESFKPLSRAVLAILNCDEKEQ